MILTIYLIILILAIVLVISASFVSSPVLGIVGYTFLFLAGLVLLNGTLQYSDGTLNVTMTNESQASSSYISAPVYQTWDDGDSHLYGWLLCIMGAFGFVLVLFGLKGEYFRPPGSGPKPWKGPLG